MIDKLLWLYFVSVLLLYGTYLFIYKTNILDKSSYSYIQKLITL